MIPADLSPVLDLVDDPDNLLSCPVGGAELADGDDETALDGALWRWSPTLLGIAIRSARVRSSWSETERRERFIARRPMPQPDGTAIADDESPPHRAPLPFYVRLTGHPPRNDEEIKLERARIDAERKRDADAGRECGKRWSASADAGALVRLGKRVAESKRDRVYPGGLVGCDVMRAAAGGDCAWSAEFAAGFVEAVRTIRPAEFGVA